MSKLRDDHGPIPTLRALRFLAIRMRTRVETAHFARDIEAHRAVLSSRHEGHEQAVEEHIAAAAEVSYWDAVLELISGRTASQRATVHEIASRRRLYDEAAARCEACEIAEERARKELEIATERARNAHNALRDRLALAFPHDLALVASFFRLSVQAATTRALRESTRPTTPVRGAHRPRRSQRPAAR